MTSLPGSSYGPEQWLTYQADPVGLSGGPVYWLARQGLKGFSLREIDPLAKRRKDGPSLFGDEAAPEVGAYGPAKRGATLAEPPAPADRPDFSGSESVCIPRPAGGWTATRLLAAAEIALSARPTLDLLAQLVVCRKCEGVSRPSPRLRATCAALLCGASNVQSFAGFAEEHFGGVPFRAAEAQTFARSGAAIDQVEPLRARVDRLERAIREALPWLVEMGGRPAMPLSALNILEAALEAA